MKKKVYKGIILAGGNGTRLKPLTNVINKALLPVHDKPMIYHLIETLKGMNCKEIMIVSSPEHVGKWYNYWVVVEKWGLNLHMKFKMKLVE